MKLEKLKNRRGLIPFAAIIILSISTFFHSAASGKASETHKKADAREKTELLSMLNKTKKGNKFKAGKNPYIAKIEIKGVICEASERYNQKWLLETIENLSEDANNKGIILYIDSPGGTVYHSDEAYLALMEYKNKTSRPIYAYFSTLAASGGYYIACSSDYIMANRNCLTGSIGVIAGRFTDLTGLMEKYGVKIRTIHSGRNKIMGSYEESPTEEQIEIMQSLADETYEQFVGIVRSSRGLSWEDTVKLADGRIYSAAQAEKNHLIDSTGSFKDLTEAMTRKAFDFNEYEVVDYSYKEEETLYKMIMGLAGRWGTSASASSIPSQVQKVLDSKLTYPAYYWENQGNL